MAYSVRCRPRQYSKSASTFATLCNFQNLVVVRFFVCSFVLLLFFSTKNAITYLLVIIKVMLPILLLPTKIMSLAENKQE